MSGSVPGEAARPSRRIRRGRVVAVIGLLIVAAAVGIGACGVAGDPDRHAQGAGPLGSLSAGTHIAIGSVRPPDGRITYGVELCLQRGDDVATVESVGPGAPIGTGFATVGTLMRTFDVEPGADSNHEPIGSVEGFPPSPEDVTDHLSEAVGYPVQVRCTPDGPPVTYTELLIGLAAVGETGGGWHGVDVGYRFGGRHRHVTFDYDLCIQGSEVSGDCSPVAGR